MRARGPYQQLFRLGQAASRWSKDRVHDRQAGPCQLQRQRACVLTASGRSLREFCHAGDDVADDQPDAAPLAQPQARSEPAPVREQGRHPSRDEKRSSLKILPLVPPLSTHTPASRRHRHVSEQAEPVPEPEAHPAASFPQSLASGCSAACIVIVTCFAGLVKHDRHACSH